MDNASVNWWRVGGMAATLALFALAVSTVWAVGEVVSHHMPQPREVPVAHAPDTGDL